MSQAALDALPVVLAALVAATLVSLVLTPLTIRFDVRYAPLRSIVQPPTELRRPP